jgi:hypothetical protein
MGFGALVGGVVISGLCIGPQGDAGANTTGKPGNAQKKGEDFAQHGQNGRTMSAACWP